MKKYKFLLVFITLITLFSFNKVFAYENLDTYYNFEIDENSFNLDNTFGATQHTFREIFDTISNLESNYYDIMIFMRKDYINNINSSSLTAGVQIFDVYLVQKNSIIEYQISGRNSTGRFFSTKHGNSIRKFSFKNNRYWSSSSFFDKEIYSSFLNCYQNNVCPSSGTQYPSSNGNFGNYYNNVAFPDFIYYDNSITFDNNSSYNLIVDDTYNKNLQTLIYYTNFNLVFSTSLYTDDEIFTKNLKFNDLVVRSGDRFPTYLDIFSNNSDSDFDINKELDNYNSLSNFYFRINKNDISNFNFTYEFNPLYALSLVISNPNYFDDFYDDLGVGIKYFGRKYDSTNNYYTYDEINCSLNHTYLKNSNTINSNGSNLTCFTDLTDYDYIYLYIDQFLKSNDSINPTIKYVNLQVNGASYHYGDYIGFIYDRFDNLSSDFEMSFSSNETGFSSVYSNIDYGLIAEKVRVNNSEGFVPTALSIQPLEFSYDYKAYFVVFNDSNKYNGTRNIEFFTFPNTIISFSDNENNKFYIYDENKNINSAIARIQYYLNDTSSYDLNYYFKQVNDYINGFSVQITNLGNLTQNMYDNLPSFLQIFIFVSFVLFCVYFTFKLIKK